MRNKLIAGTNDFGRVESEHGYDAVLGPCPWRSDRFWLHVQRSARSAMNFAFATLPNSGSFGHLTGCARRFVEQVGVGVSLIFIACVSSWNPADSL
jgi:hypothetical protein